MDWGQLRPGQVERVEQLLLLNKVTNEQDEVRVAQVKVAQLQFLNYIVRVEQLLQNQLVAPAAFLGGCVVHDVQLSQVED